jgi:hypothetical protein
MSAGQRIGRTYYDALAMEERMRARGKHNYEKRKALVKNVRNERCSKCEFFIKGKEIDYFRRERDRCKRALIAVSTDLHVHQYMSIRAYHHMACFEKGGE